jgi:hypothetical protein
VTAEIFAPVIADFNADGRPDYVVGGGDTFECSEGMVYSNGQAGYAYDFFISTPRGYARDEGMTSVEPVAIDTFENRPVAMVSAGGPGAYERPYWSFAYGWTGREMADLAFFDLEGRRVNEDGTRIGGGGWERVDFLPEGYPAGFYAEDCHEAARDPEGMAYLYLTQREWRQFDGPSMISRIERNGAVRFRIHIAVEDEEGNATPVALDVVTGMLGQFSVLRSGEEPQYYSWCEDRQVPAQVRRNMAGR